MRFDSARGLLETDTKIVLDSGSSSYRIGFSIGIPPKGSMKRVRHNESLPLGCIEFNLSRIRAIESQLCFHLSDFP